MKADFLAHQSSGLRFLKTFNSFLTNHLNTFSSSFQGQEKLLQAIKYSLFSGGKRFRPLLIFSVAEILSIKDSLILPWAGAIEMMHTASLIHDDLPCMDNSLYRRGKATNHRLFGEDIALLAGDCLWVEAFRLVESYPEWVKILCQAGGFYGLMGGQALDLYPPPIKERTNRYYEEMNAMKTTALISAGVQGVFLLNQTGFEFSEHRAPVPLVNKLQTTEFSNMIGIKKEETTAIKNLKQVGHLIGQAFQLSDDLQDFADKKSNFAVSLGYKTAQKKLKALSEKALDLVAKAGFSDSLLSHLIIFNQNRCEK